MIFITAYFCYAVSILFIMGCATRRLFEKISSPQSFAFPPNLVNILILGISAIIFLAMCSIRKLKICLNLLAIQGILMIGITFWFFSAPAFRFGKGWIWGFIILSFGALFYLILKSVRPQFVCYLSRFICVLVCIAFINLLLFRWDTLEVILGKHSRSLSEVSPLPKAQLRAIKTH